MIRLINRRLIIPRGDTGSFTIPVLTNSSAADISVFTIFDCLTRRKVFQKEIIAADNTLTVEFTHEDTVNLVPGKYVWDIKYYKNPTYAEGELIDGEEVDSYYAGFSLPVCEIKETGDTLLLADDAPTSTMSPLQLNVINAAISETNASKRDAATSASAAATSANEASASAAAALQSQTSAEDAAGAAINAKNAAISASETAVSAKENAETAQASAEAAASTATTKAEEAAQSAADALSVKIDALAAVSEISNLQVQTTTLNPTSTATASYNSNTGILSLGIPRGHGVASVAKTATNGLIDTYTITFTNGNTTTFNVTNGDSGVYYGTTAPTNPNVNVWIDPSGASWNETIKQEVISGLSRNRVASLNNTALTNSNVVEAVGTPVYIDNFAEYSAYNISTPGWYVFARIQAPENEEVGANTTVTGAAGYIATIGEHYIDVAIRFDVAAESQTVTIIWSTSPDIFIFKATDLAVRNLDYRTTFYIYDIAPYTTWTYTLTTDTTFVAGRRYFTLENGIYTEDTNWVAGDPIPADTYYKHASVTFSGMVQNITYKCDEIIDCPQIYVLPEINDDIHGCWYEIRLRHNGSYSSTLQVPEGVKVATEHTQAETAGLNMVDLHYSNVGGVKLWRFLNTHSTIPA